jgi:tetratricopeptide (TPR) repeat protein
MRLRLVAMGMLLLMGCCGLLAAGQAQTDKSDADVKTESDQAQALYAKGNFVAALPLYEELHAARPASTLFEERLAMALLGGSGQPAPTEAKAIRLRAKTLLLDARSKGDDSNLSQVLLEKLGQTEEAGDAPPVAGKEWFDKGEAAFGKGDLAGAVGFYSKALEVNPQYYSAATYAGDAEFKMGHPAEAGKWFAKAIAIDPDTETAHRYWGDCLEKDGDHQRAEEQFIQAIVADPYSKSPRVGLKQWAERNHARVLGPPITLPAQAVVSADGKVNITIGGDLKKDDPEASFGLIYSMESATWQSEEFKKRFPKEAVYRHTLVEEAESIRGMLGMVSGKKKAQDKLSTSTKLLLELDKNGMLECWILLDNPDQGIAQDYVAYRKDHRELLAKYIAQYDVHAM